MSNTTQDWYDEEDFDDTSDNGQNSGDDVLRKVRRSERAKDKRVKELESELESLRNFQRETLVTKVLSEKGINPKVAKFIPNNVEVSSETINAWLDENADIFGFTQQEETIQSAANANDIAALQEINSVVNNAHDAGDPNDLYARLNNAQSAEEIINMINGF